MSGGKRGATRGSGLSPACPHGRLRHARVIPTESAPTPLAGARSPAAGRGWWRPRQAVVWTFAVKPEGYRGTRADRAVLSGVVGQGLCRASRPARAAAKRMVGCGVPREVRVSPPGGGRS